MFVEVWVSKGAGLVGIGLKSVRTPIAEGFRYSIRKKVSSSKKIVLEKIFFCINFLYFKF